MNMAATGPHVQLGVVCEGWYVVQLGPAGMGLGHGQHLWQKRSQFGPGHVLHISQVHDAGVVKTQAGDPSAAGGDAQVVLAAHVGMTHASVGHQDAVAWRQRDVGKNVPI